MVVTKGWWLEVASGSASEAKRERTQPGFLLFGFFFCVADLRNKGETNGDQSCFDIKFDVGCSKSKM